jgi:hypothetical protein
MRSGEHLSEVELVLFLDGEMSRVESSFAESHLKACSECRALLEETRLTAVELEGFEFPVQEISAADAARASLKMRLGESRGKSSISLGERFRAFGKMRKYPDYFYGAVAAAGITVVFFCVPSRHRSMAEISASLPNRALTPGMTRQVDVAEMCSAGDDEFDPTVSYSTQRAVFNEYGISIDRSAKDFQVDYLISPQLGGTDDVRNLWPQSYKSTTWNAVAKDKLERHLYQMVCEKKINLADAQREIATNWIAAYQKYFGTSRPA